MSDSLKQRLLQLGVCSNPSICLDVMEMGTPLHDLNFVYCLIWAWRALEIEFNNFAAVTKIEICLYFPLQLVPVSLMMFFHATSTTFVLDVARYNILNRNQLKFIEEDCFNETNLVTKRFIGGVFIRIIFLTMMNRFIKI